MVIFEWDDRYVTNVSEIDADHRNLIDIVNKAFESMIQGGSPTVHEVLGQLSDYTRGHFARELAYMRRSEYPGMEQHLQAHAYFARRVEELKAHDAKDTLTIAIKLCLLLHDWLREHLLGEDRRLFEHVRSVLSSKDET